MQSAKNLDEHSTTPTTPTAQLKKDYSMQLGIGLSMIACGWFFDGTKEFGAPAMAVGLGTTGTVLTLLEIYIQHIYDRVERLKIARERGLLTDDAKKQLGFFDDIALKSLYKVESTSTAPISTPTMPQAQADSKTLKKQKQIPRPRAANKKRKDLATYNKQTLRPKLPQSSSTWFSTNPLTHLRQWWPSKPAHVLPIEEFSSDEEEIPQSTTKKIAQGLTAAPSKKKKRQKPPQASSVTKVATNSSPAQPPEHTVVSIKSTALRPRSVSDPSLSRVQPKPASTTVTPLLAQKIEEKKRSIHSSQLEEAKKAIEFLENQLTTAKREGDKSTEELRGLKQTLSLQQEKLTTFEQEKSTLVEIEKKLAAAEEDRARLADRVARLFNILTSSEAKSSAQTSSSKATTELTSTDLEKMDTMLETLQTLVQQVQTLKKLPQTSGKGSDGFDIFEGAYTPTTRLGDDFIKLVDAFSQPVQATPSRKAL